MSVTLKSVSGKTTQVFPVGYGLMNLSWRDTPVPDEDAFKLLKHALDATKKAGQGKLILSSALLYDPKGLNGDGHNVALLGRFFDKYPDLAEHAFLAVKAGLRANPPGPDGSHEFLRQETDTILAKLGKNKKLDCFVMNRMDQKRPIEETMRALNELAKEGRFTHIAISEASANTVRRAAKVGGLSFHEFEYSPIAEDIVEPLGIAQACIDNDIPVLAYAPTGRGILTGSIKSLDDIPKGDVRHGFARFQPGNFEKNLELYKHFEELAKRKKCSTAQLCLAWVKAQRGTIIPLFGTTRTSALDENFASLDVKLSKQDLDDMRTIIDKAQPSGDRGGDHSRAMNANDTPEEK